MLCSTPAVAVADICGGGGDGTLSAHIVPQSVDRYPGREIGDTLISALQLISVLSFSSVGLSVFFYYLLFIFSLSCCGANALQCKSLRAAAWPSMDTDHPDAYYALCVKMTSQQIRVGSDEMKWWKWMHKYCIYIYIHIRALSSVGSGW